MGQGGKTFFVYIIGSARGVLYIGVTNDLERRLHEHRLRTSPGFSSHYRTARLLYFEQTDQIYSALEREKQLKGWRRRRKLELIRTMNPTFSDLSAPSAGELGSRELGVTRWNGLLQPCHPEAGRRPTRDRPRPPLNDSPPEKETFWAHGLRSSGRVFQ